VAKIDPTARVADGAKVADDAEIGPYCIVGAQVEIQSGARLMSHVNVAGVTVIGERTTIYPFASIGTPPQSVHYHDEPTRLVIGAECRICEGVTMNTGTVQGGGVTSVGDRCFFMANSHVAHDCHIGNNVVFANNVLVGGHVTVGDNSFLGGAAMVHQFGRVGENAMIAGLSGCVGDVIPFGFATGLRAKLVGLNNVGLKRRGYSRVELHRLRSAYRALFFGPGTFRERTEAVARDFADDPIVGKILAFIQAAGSRPLMMAAQERGEEQADAKP